LQAETPLPIYKVDVSTLSKGDLAELNAKYSIASIPAVYEFKNGVSKHLDLGQIYASIQSDTRGGEAKSR